MGTTLTSGTVIEYKGKEILVNSDSTFTVYYSKYSANTVKECKTIASAKKQIDKWLS